MTLWTNAARTEVHDDMNGTALTLAVWPKGLTQITQAEADAILASLIKPVPLPQRAQSALDLTDRVAYRCFKAGVVFPASWQTYTQSLRAIANGTDKTSTALPVQPAYPAGT